MLNHEAHNPPGGKTKLWRWWGDQWLPGGGGVGRGRNGQSIEDF